jgi:membrane fusion protein, multidrug efflux system
MHTNCENYEKNNKPLLSSFVYALTYLALMTGLVSLLIFLSGCTSSSGSEAGGPPPPPSLPVITLQATAATTFQDFSASIEGSKDIEIRPQVDGYIERIYVDEGAKVRQGQALFLINDRPYREQLNNAQATLSAAKANLANAEINVSKLTPLVQSNVVSEVQLKTAKANYDAAAAAVSQAQAMVNNAAINVGYTVIKAPTDGYIGRIPFKTGSLVGLSTPQALTVLSAVKEVYAYFSLSENDFLRFKEQYAGATVEEKIKSMPAVELVLADNSVYAQKGKVETILGQFNNSTGAISFRAIFPNADNFLRSGNTGKVRIPQLHKEQLAVPQESTFEIQDKVFVFAVGDSNKIASKPISISGKTSTYYFIESGLKAGEKIVISGTGNLADGMVITPQLLSNDSLLKVKPL